MDNSQFVRGKGPILNEYLRSRKKIGDGVAAKGFTFEPGFMYDIQNDLEADTKFKLSELNYTILEEAVKRRLQQDGQDYDLAYKNAVVAWESDKATLLAEWDRELVMIKQDRAIREEELNAFAIEVSKRGALLIAAKTVIERDAEALRRQIAELDGTMGDQEMALALAKQRTAEKKLEIIPYIEQIIGIEEQLVGKEELLTNKSQSIVAKAYELIEKEYLVLDKDQQIANKTVEIAGKMLELAAKDMEIVAENEVIAIAAREIAEKVSEIVTQNADIVKIEDQLADKKVEILSVETAVENVKSESISKDIEVVEKNREVADKTDQIINKEFEIIAKNKELIAKESVLISTANDLITKENEIIAINTEIAVISQEITDTLLEIASTNTEILGKESEIAVIKEAIVLIAEQLSDKKADIIAVDEEIAQKRAQLNVRRNTLLKKEQEILTAEKSLFSFQDAVITTQERVTEAEAAIINKKINSLLPAMEDLIAAQESVADETNSLIPPALEALTAKMEEYIAELAIQQELYNSIIDSEGARVTIEQDQIGIMEEIVGKKSQVTELISQATTLLSDLYSYKEATLAPALTDLISAHNAHSTVIAEQANLQVAIADVQAEISRLTINEVEWKSSVADARVAQEAQRELLDTVVLNLTGAKSAGEVNKISTRVTNTAAELTEKTNTRESVVDRREQLYSMLRDLKEQIQTTKFNIEIATKTSLEEARQQEHKQRVKSDINRDQEIANAKTNSNGVTARLEHLLTQD